MNRWQWHTLATNYVHCTRYKRERENTGVQCGIGLSIRRVFIQHRALPYYDTTLQWYIA